MRTRIASVICLYLLFADKASAQWVVSDPGNLTQGIINVSKNIIHTSKTAMNMVNNFQEAMRICKQGKKYYSALKSVNNLIRDVRRVQRVILMVGDITDIYVTSFQKMLRDDNFMVEELGAIVSGYTKPLEESNDVLTELKNMVSTTTLSMMDKERMDVAERCHSKIERHRNLVSYCINKNVSVGYLRTRKKSDLDRTMGLYGSMNERYWQPMEFGNLHQILRSPYEQMMPPCADMVGVAKDTAGLDALFYVAYRVWQSLARVEPVSIFPILRPSAVGLCIMFFPAVVPGIINSVLSPVVQGTVKLLEMQTLDMNKYHEQKDGLEYEVMVRNPGTTYLVSSEEFDKQLEELGWPPSNTMAVAGMYIDRGMYKMKRGTRDFLRKVLELMFQTAVFVIGTIRTFFLMVLAILGPIVFAILVQDGFQNMLTQWIRRYIQVYLWLPVSGTFSTIFAKIQVLMLQSDIERTRTDPNFPPDFSDGVYIAFMIIGIIGYLTIPTVADQIIQTGGMDDYGRNVNQVAGRVGGMAGSMTGVTAGNMAGCVGKLLK